MSNKETSTLQSTIDSVASSAQSALGSLTGNPGDKRAADKKQAESEARDDLSHATARAGPFTATAGGIAKDDPNRSDGQWNQTVGSAKETVGNLIGNDSLKAQGVRQNREGQEQQAAGQLSDLGKGVSDRISGAVGGTLAGVTGNKEQEEAARRQHDEGKTRQRGVEADLQKQVDAQQK